MNLKIQKYWIEIKRILHRQTSLSYTTHKTISRITYTHTKAYVTVLSIRYKLGI